MEQQGQLTRPAGTLIQERYVIQDLLGRGGFGAVYLVRDQQETDSFAALKELREQSEVEKERLRVECAILQRLDHPSLPAVRGIFEQDQRMYMLMEYIAGPNLELLRQKQLGKRFPFPLVVSLIRPIIEAVTYLHAQTPPLMHRDIKPANMIVPEDSGRTCLVDFGVAKEYVADATTTAVRHCSPGYSAPEQYSSLGTDPRADVYSLGATCYTLLTGTLPVDALQRMTRLANKGPDPLVPVSELVPDVPPGAATAIQIAMSINYARRFATPAAFWQAFTGEAQAELIDPSLVEDEDADDDDLGADQNHTPRLPGRAQGSPVLWTEDASNSKMVVSNQTVIRHQWRQNARIFHHEANPVHSRRVSDGEVRLPAPSLPLHTRLSKLILALILTLLILGSAFSLWAYAPRATVSRTQNGAHATSTHAGANGYPALAASYTGTLDNLLTHTTLAVTLKNVQQNTQSFQASLWGAPTNQPRHVSGVIDLSRRLLFTVAAQGDQPRLSFDGSIRADGVLVGNYCSVDASGQCANGAYGLWTLAPMK